jgi:uncharacterized protein YndB with AHSA1/START domain
VVRVEQDVAAAPAAVFAVLSDPTTYPEWLVGAKHIRRVDADFPERDASFGHEVGAGVLAVDDSTTVERVVPEHELQLIVRARPFLVARARFRIEETATGARVLLDEEPIGVYRAFRFAIEPLVRVRNRASLRRLAEFLARPATEVA